MGDHHLVSIVTAILLLAVGTSANIPNTTSSSSTPAPTTSTMTTTTTTAPILCDTSNLQITHGTLTVGQGDQHNVDHTVTFDCNPGYSFNGSHTVTCQDDGTWNPSSPTCNINHCTEVLNIENGNKFPNQGPPYPVNTIVTFNCSTGYTLHGTHVTCQNNGTWTSTTPSCHINHCVALASQANAAITYDLSGTNVTGIQQYPYQTKANITCNAGYRVDDEESSTSYERTCNANKSWTEEKQCKLRERNHGETCDDEGPDTQCKYTNSSCENGKCKCRGNLVFINSTTGCVEICDTSNLQITHGTLTAGQGSEHNVGDTVTFNCNPGYSLDGLSNATCQGDGTWNPSSLKCNINNCTDDLTIENGNKIPSQGPYPVNTTVTFNCSTGYTLQGPNVTCQSDGKWTTQTPSCNIIHCTALAQQANAAITYYDLNGTIVTGTQPYPYQTKATITCDAGYRVENSDGKKSYERNCTDTTDWSAEKQCILREVDYGQPCDTGGPLTQCNYNNSLCEGGKCVCNGTLVFVNSTTGCVKRIPPYLTVNFRNTTQVTLNIARGNGPGDSFLVCNKNKTGDCKTVNIENPVPFGGLTSASCYNFTVQIANDQQAVLNSTIICTRPSHPVNVATIKVSSFETTIRWQFDGIFEGIAVNNADTGDQLTFNLDYKAGSKSQYSNGTISGLTPSTVYSFQLIAEMHGISGKPSDNLSFCTNSDVPKNCTCSHRTNSSVLLEWEKGTGPYKEFNVNEVSTNNMNLSEDLKAGQSKTFSISTSSTCENDYTLSKACSVHVTALPPDPTDVAIDDNKNTSVTVKWNKPEGTVVDSYDIAVRITGTDIEVKRNNSTDQTITISGLSPGTQYTVEIRSVRMETGTGCEDDDGNKTLYSVNTASQTFYTRPNAPTATIYIRTVNETGFTVEWQNSSNRCSYYHVVVEAVNDESDYQSKNTTTRVPVDKCSEPFSVSFNELKPGRQYTVRVYTVIGDSLMSELFTSSSSFTVPKIPAFISIVNITSTDMVFTSNHQSKDEFSTWNVIIVNTTTGYNRTVTFNRSTSRGNVTDLSPGTRYKIQFYVSVPGFKSASTSAIYNYTDIPPVLPASVVVQNTTANSLTIKWTSPSVGVASDYSYVVTFTCTSPNRNRSQSQHFGEVTGTSAYIDGLDPGSKCTVNILTKIGSQESGMTKKTLDRTTDETAPRNIREINTTNTLADSFVVSWKDPVIRNGVIRRYDLLITKYRNDACEPGDPGDETSIECIRRIVFNCDNCKPVPKNTLPDRPVHNECNEIAERVSHTFNQSQTDFNHTITDLHPYMNYNVTIIPYTVVNGSESQTSQVTAEHKPAEPPQNLSVTSTTSDTIALSWDPPSCGKRNGKIISYDIRAYHKEHLCTDLLTNTLQNQIKYVNATGNVTTTKLNDLYSFWDYRIVIRALTVKTSNWSQYIDQRTNSSVPSEVRSLNVTSVSTNSLNVIWTQPCYPNGIINKYTITTTNLDDLYGHTIDPTTTNDNNTQATISSLLPYRNYTMVIEAHVKGYQGNRSIPTNVTTAIGLPEQPTFVEAKSINSSIILVSWNVNKYTGPTTFYAEAKASDTVSKKCSPVPDFKARTCNIDDLLPYKNYTISINAETKAGISTSDEKRIVQTLEAEPGNVTNLDVTTQTNVLLPRSILVQWQPPFEEHRNGKLIGYVIEAQSELNNQEFGTFQRCIINETNDDKHCESKNINIVCQKPKTNTEYWMCNLTRGVSTGKYILVVSAITAPGNGSKSYQDITVDPGAPLKPDESPNNPLVKQATSSVSEPEYQISVAFSRDFLCGKANGDIVQWGVVVSEESRVIDVEPFAGTTKDFESHKKIYKTWSQVYGDDVDMLPYIASPARWNPCTATRRKRSTAAGGDEPPVTFIAGENSGCSESASQETCNGKLVPGKSYRAKAFVCTEGGCTETMYSAPISTDKLTPIALIVGVVMAVIVVLVVIGVTILLKRRQMFCFAKRLAEEGRTHRTEPPTSGSEMKDISKSTSLFKIGAVKIADFPKYCDRLHRDSKMLFTEAYTLLRDKSPTPAMSAAEKQSNRPKNRYTNILSYDHSRVKLLPMDDDEDSDYINANYIPGYTSRREYIATQGPLPATLNDFWRMVWEQNVDTIVMLTREVEKGRRKCERYWPDLNEPCYYGDLVVCVQSESHLSDYTIRVIEVKLKAARRVVRQFHYLKWPDMGCPEEPSYLIDFVKSVRGYSKTESTGKNPMVVHCSAGVGRTGTFIAVDYLLQYVRDHDDIDIYKFVLEMRNHRSNMVQTEDQYVYIHECMREFITTDEEDDEDEDDEPTYANTGVGNEENVYENTAFSANM